MPTHRWRIDFSLLGVPITREFTLDSIRLTPQSRKEQGLSGSAGYLILETDEYLEKGVVYARAVSRLRALALAAAAISGSVQEPKVTLITLENEAELSAAGVRTPLLDDGLLIGSNVIEPDVDEATLTVAFHAVEALEEQEAAAWLRSARWLWKANSDPEPYDQFLGLWISFNVRYGQYKRHSEQAAIREYLDAALATEEDARGLIALVSPHSFAVLAASGLTLPTTHGSRPIADQLRDAVATAQFPGRELVALAMLTIYAVRCAIVHEGGTAVPKDIEAGLVIASRDILKVALMHLLRRRLSASVGA